MRWPRLSQRRSENSKSPQRRSQSSSSSSSEAPQADKETDTTPPPAPDPSLTRLFSDAASYDKILNPRTDVAENNAEDSRAAHDSPSGFSELVARDLDDQERVASETLAQLSVSTWAPGESTDLAPDVAVDESEEGPPEGEHDKIEPSGITQAAVEPKFEELKPDEVLDLLQQDFGALAPPGEEKLLLETDATLFQEVVVLVCQFIWDYP